MLTCPQLSSLNIRHGFFGRTGGVSSGLYTSLNCGYGSGDDKELVAQNRAIVAKSVGAGGDICTAYQIHSAKVAVLDAPYRWQDSPEVDALVTRTPGIALGVLTADCLPILLADGKARVIAAVHAGWKGAIGGVIESALEAMASLGATQQHISACIGPSIAQASYEVGPEFRERFIEQAPENQNYFIVAKRDGHFLFDLRGYAAARLRKAGILQVNVLPQDTCSQENEYFSYRRSCLNGETSYGRQVAVITLKKE